MKYLQIALSLVVVLAFSCSSPRIVDLETAEGGRTDGKEEAMAVTLFVLGPGDELAVNIWRNEELNRSVKVDPSGNIYVPLAGEIRASGLTVSQLREKAVSRLSKYIVDPQVDINVLTLRSRRVHVLGEVESPGTLSLNGEMLVFEAISKSGGFTVDANEENILLVRNEDNVIAATALNLNVKQMLENKSSYQDRRLRNGDIVYVPPKRIADVERFMRRLNNIIAPFVTIERGIVLGPEVIDALKGENEAGSVIVAP